MTLEPLQPVATEGGPSPELRDMTRRFWIGAALSFPLLLLEMGPHITTLNPLRLMLLAQSVTGTAADGSVL
jgi:Cu+-exporting ATPase